MSIADKITSIEDNLRADYEGLENIYGEITGINKNILNIRTILDNIYNDMPKVTGEGTEVTLSPTRKGRLSLIPKGNSTQGSTTGKQLWQPYNFTRTNANGIDWTTSTDGTIKANGTSTNSSYSAVASDLTSLSYTLVAGTYTLSGGTSNLVLQIISGGTQLYSTDSTGKVTFTLDTDTSIQIRARLDSGVTATNLVVKPMLNSGSSVENWEQYTNGPAPNPSYPFPIKSVTGNNNVVVNNKNLIISTVSGKTINSNGSLSNSNDFDVYLANVTEGTTYTVTNGTTGLVYTYYTDITLTTNIFNTRYVLQNTTTFTATATGIVAFRTDKNYSTSQLELGSTATPYVPYQNQTKPLSLGDIELNKIGNYKDYIYKTSGKNLFTGLTKGIGLDTTNGNSGPNANHASSDYIPVDFSKNSSYYLSGLTDKLSSLVWAYNSNKQGLGRTGGEARTGIELTATSFTRGTPQGTGDIAYIKIDQYYTTGNTGTIDDVDNLKIMLNTGSTVLPYEPYGSGKWYKKEVIGKLLLGNYDWVYSEGKFKLPVTTMKRTDYIISNSFKYSLENSIDNSIYNQTANFGNIQIRYDVMEGNITNFKNFCNNNNVVAYSPLTTPQDIEITDQTLISQLEEIDKMQGYNGTTIITSTFDENNSQMIISASGLKGE